MRIAETGFFPLVLPVSHADAGRIDVTNWRGVERWMDAAASQVGEWWVFDVIGSGTTRNLEDFV
jgi:hypothetical protein